MLRLFPATIILAACLGAALAQDQTPSGNPTGPANMGQAPSEPNGIGRADVRIVDESGAPVKGAFAKLESSRTDGYYCESWNTSDAQGVAVLPPIHMGRLQLVVKARGFQTQKVDVAASSFAQPFKVTVLRKK